MKKISKPENEVAPNNELEKLRNEIDQVDFQIMQLLKLRMDLVIKVGKYKKERGIPALDMKRWTFVLENKLAIAKDLGINTDMVRHIYNRIHEEALDLEK